MSVPTTGRRRRAPAFLPLLTALAVAGCSSTPEELDPGMIAAVGEPAGGSEVFQATALTEEARAELLDGAPLPSASELPASLTPALVEEGVAWILDFVATVAVDGATIEGDLVEAWAPWAEGAAPALLDPAFAGELLTPVLYADGTAGPPPLTAHAAGLPFALEFVHDGGPRFLAGELVVAEVAAGEYSDGRAWVSVSGSARYVARVEDAVILEQLAVLSVQSGEAASVEELVREHPQLDDEREERALVVFDFDFTAALFDDGWRVTDYAPEGGLAYEWMR